MISGGGGGRQGTNTKVRGKMMMEVYSELVCLHECKRRSPFLLD